jgi:IrrE N-terminal-like domain/N-terminal domain of anti-restriction factor ArdC
MAKSTARHPSAHQVPRPVPPSFSELLVEAVEKPGLISQAYFHFHSYSISNQLLALIQCLQRKLEPGPIHTYKGWAKLNRQVNRGQTALTLCMPVTWVQKSATTAEAPTEPVPTGKTEVVRRRFVFRPFWFVLDQTSGDALPSVSVPTWDQAHALRVLNIEVIRFDLMDGNTQGYARARQVAVSPIAHLPHRTLIHEIAHVVLGHTAESVELVDQGERTPRDIREVEAEAVAYLVTQTLGMPGDDFSRGYLQHWMHGQPIDDRSAQRIFHAADQILRAGRPATQPSVDARAD